MTDLTNNIKAVVTFPRTTGIARDEVENTFFFAAVGSGVAAYGDTLAAAIESFYNGVSTGTPLHDWMNISLDRSSLAHIRFYDMLPILAGGTSTGPPLQDHTFTLGAAGDASLMPDEVAAVLSFHGELTGVPEHDGATRPRARRRGRVYIGPLTSNNPEVIATTSGLPRIGSTLLLSLEEAGLRLSGTLADDAVMNWAVYSRVDNTFYPVVGGFVDNAFDTQRRRQLDASTRTAWGAF